MTPLWWFLLGVAMGAAAMFLAYSVWLAVKFERVVKALAETSQRLNQRGGRVTVGKP